MIEERSDEPDGSDPDSMTADPSTGSGSDPIPGGECQLRLRLSTGRDLRLAVRSTDTVGMMKRRLQNQEGVPAASQRWFFSGRPLTDRLRLDQLNISKDYVVQVILSQRPPPEPVTPPGHTAEPSVPAVVEGVSAQPQEPTPVEN
ncbi:Ubiquitin domain-containing protein 2 [Ilyodon furcidens]|uniref:Ubiquitin domain-containing protein 2 n=1 Tax=Ilyodon furcidens TaxID=33524 RepID=A0ABV0SJ56_9TELE